MALAVRMNALEELLRRLQAQWSEWARLHWRKLPADAQVGRAVGALAREESTVATASVADERDSDGGGGGGSQRSRDGDAFPTRESDAALHVTINALEAERDALRIEMGMVLYSPTFGSVFRTENKPTLFADGFAKYTDVYTARLENLLAVPPADHRFFPPRRSLPHEQPEQSQFVRGVFDAFPEGEQSLW